MRAVLSIGSNMGDRKANLRIATDDFADEIVAISPIFCTKPWGVEDQPDFYNITMIVDVDCTPHELLARGQRLEEQAKRVREYKWGPRTLDVDIVAFDDLTITTDDLVIPHPFAHERAFVLVPWLAIEPNAEINGEKVAEIVDKLEPSDRAAVVEVGEL